MALHQSACLFDQSLLKHSAASLVDPLVEQGPFGIQADAKHTEASERVASALLPKLRHLPAGSDAHLDGADHLRPIVGINVGGDCGIQPAQYLVMLLRA